MDLHMPERSAPTLATTRPEGGRAKRRKILLRSGGQEIEILDIWRTGFSILRDGPRPTRGFVDIFEGERHIFHGLAYPTRDDHERRIFAFKSGQPAEAQPPRDYASRSAELR